MKLRIKKNLLLENLNKVEHAISSKAFDPALSGIKFDLTEKGLTLLASDGDISIEAYIEKNNDMEIEEIGGTIIPAKYFLEIVKKTSAKSLYIEVLEDQKILITLGKSEFNLNGTNVNEYPKIDLTTKENKIAINSKEFKEGINQISFATSVDEERPVITGINLKINGDLLEVSATDSYRLGRRFIKISDEIKDNINVTIPKNNALDIVKLINNDNEELLFSFYDNKVIVEIGNCTFESRLINGAYPNVSNLFPKDFILEINIPVNKLYSAIDMVSILITDREKNIVTLEINEDKLTLTSTSQEIGRAFEEIDLEKKYDKFKISFSPRYMLEALKTFKTENILLSFVSDSKPIVLTDNENNNLSHLVLPIRTY